MDSTLDQMMDSEEFRIISGPRIAAIKRGVMAAWERSYPIGAPIYFWPGDLEGPGRESRVRSAPWVLPSGVVVALVDEYAGGIAITHIMPREG